MKHVTNRLPELAASVRRCIMEQASTDDCTIIHNRGGGRGMLLRLHLRDAPDVIVKAWALRNLRERIKCWLGISNGAREWKMHCRVQQLGLRVPQPVAYSQVVIPSGRYEIMVVEDLGETTKALQYLKRCLARKDDAEIARLEESVIEMAHLLVRAGVVDVDHQLNNIVLDASNEIVRIDLECARRCRPGRVPTEAYSTMIARLICTHAYACQPDLHLTEAFARTLSDRLQPPAAVLELAEAIINRNLKKQHRRKGIDSRLSLAW